MLVRFADLRARSASTALVFTLAGFAVASTVEAQCLTWDRTIAAPQGLDDEGWCAIGHDDGGGPAIFAGGHFLSAGGAPSRRIARWNGASWSALGLGFDDAVFGLESVDLGSGPRLYAVGQFLRDSTGLGGQYFGRVAAWNGASWSALAGGLNQSAQGVVAWDDGAGTALYVCGSFTVASGVPANRIARWNGSAWSALGSGANGPVHALCVWDRGGQSSLVASGPFTQIGGVPASGVALWNGSTWSDIGAWAHGPGAIATFDDGGGSALYLAAGAEHIARWDGTNWTSVGGGWPYPLNSMHACDVGDGPALYASTLTPSSGGNLARALVKWDGVAWSVAAVADAGASEITGIYGMCSVDRPGHADDLVIVGTFARLNGVLTRRIAVLRGCDDAVDAFCAGDGGTFTPCPCGNSGAAGFGCAWSGSAQGSWLTWNGTTSLDSLVLAAYSMPNTGTSIFLKGDASVTSGVPYGDGVRCVGGNLVRLGTKFNSGGSAQFPSPGDPTLSVRGNTPPGSGSVAYYQTWFRNAASFCTPATFNITNGVRAVW